MFSFRYCCCCEKESKHISIERIDDIYLLMSVFIICHKLFIYSTRCEHMSVVWCNCNKTTEVIFIIEGKSLFWMRRNALCAKCRNQKEANTVRAPSRKCQYHKLCAHNEMENLMRASLSANEPIFFFGQLASKRVIQEFKS